MFDNFVKYCLSYGGEVNKLDIPSEDTEHLGVCNPSIFIDNDGKVKLILRKVNYALWGNNDDYRFASLYGPLYYITPDNDQNLRTENFLCELDNEGNFIYDLIDTKDNDWEPQWEFVGHEDMRLVRWDGKLYGTGVQRDWNTTGVGRMHLSELDDENAKEIRRVRIKSPNDDSSYCEKNWMPILDMPYHYVKWCNPLEIVKVNPETGDSETVLMKEYNQDIEYLNTEGMSIRGSSQVIPYKDGMRIALVHLCRLWSNEKNQKSNAGYWTQFIVWDKDWNIVKLSEPFTFNGFSIEFTNGLAYKDGLFYIPFALQDNFSFLVKISESIIERFIFDKDYSFGDYVSDGSYIMDFFFDSHNSENIMRMGNEYYYLGHYAASMVCYEKGCEYNTFSNIDDLYSCMYMVGLSLARLGGRDKAEESIWYKLIDLCPNRSEGYFMLYRYYSWRGIDNIAYSFAKLAYEKNNTIPIGEFSDIENNLDLRIDYVISLYVTEEYYRCYPLVIMILENENDNLTDKQKIRLYKFKYKIESDLNNKKRIL